MFLGEIWEKLIADIHKISWQEWLSTISQVVSVWYARLNNILVYPTGIVGVILAAWVYLFLTSPPLYAEGVLNIYYFWVSVYGWYNWKLKKNENEWQYPVSWCTFRERVNGIVVLSVIWILISWFLITYTDSDTAIPDALVSSSAVLAMYWMAKRKIDNWLAWIFSDIIAIPLNYNKDLILFSLMYFIFLFLAWSGLVSWKRICQTQA
jgi:nicotinamide mononucleotide transporter